MNNLKQIFCMTLCCMLVYSNVFGLVVGYSRTFGGGATLLVGDNTIKSGGATYNMVAERATTSSAPVTAVASGALAKGYFYISSWWSLGSGDNVKMLVYYNSSGDVGDLVAQSAPVAGLSQTVPGWVEFTFSSGAITSGLDYGLALIPEAIVQVPTDASPAIVISSDASGSYTSPPDPLDFDGIFLRPIGGAYVTD